MRILHGGGVRFGRGKRLSRHRYLPGNAHRDGDISISTARSAIRAPNRAQPIGDPGPFDPTHGPAILPNVHSGHLLINSVLAVKCRR